MFRLKIFFVTRSDENINGYHHNEYRFHVINRKSVSKQNIYFEVIFSVEIHPCQTSLFIYVQLFFININFLNENLKRTFTWLETLSSFSTSQNLNDLQSKNINFMYLTKGCRNRSAGTVLEKLFIKRN